MKQNRYKVLSIGLLFILIIASVGSFLLLKCHIHYRTQHPPTTYADSKHDEIDGLVFHWRLDQITNGTTPDSSKNKINGKIQYYFNDNYLPKLLYKQPNITDGKYGNSLQFNGKQWISAGNKTIYNSDKFTISAWVWQENDDIFMPTIMAKSSWHVNNDGFDGWWLCTTPKKRYLDIGIAWGNGKTHVESGYQLPLKEWHHVAVTINKQLNEIQFYIDGSPYGEKHTNIHEWIQNWNHDLLVAGYDGSQQWPWPGKIDEVRFYNTILTKGKIAAIYSENSDNPNSE